MNKMRFIALLLVAILMTFCVYPASAYAAEVSEQKIEESADTSAPYMLRTEQIDEYDANTVQVWLELDPAKAESVVSYQIALQLISGEGSAVVGREMSLTFDEALKNVKIKESNFNPDTQVMQIYVAGTENLVKIVTDDKGNTVNMLPIGTLQVEKLKGEKNTFKLILSGNTGDLTTVDLGMNAVSAQEKFGVDFVIPVDGAIYGEPVRFPLGIETEGKGTVKAYVVEEDGESQADSDIYENAVVRLSATPSEGYRLTEITLTDNRNAEHKVELGGDFKFNMTSVIGVKAVFEEIEETYTVSIGENGTILGTSENAAKFKVRAVASVIANVPDGKQFSCWKNEKNDVVSYKSTYSFAVVSDVTLIPEFAEADEEKTERPSVVLNAVGTVSPFSGKYRLSYSGVCSVPSGYKLVQRGIILINKTVNDDNLDDFVIGGTIDNVKVAACAVSGTSAQFISNVNNVGKGQLRTARAFMTYADKDGNKTIIYSANVVALTTP